MNTTQIAGKQVPTDRGTIPPQYILSREQKEELRKKITFLAGTTMGTLYVFGAKWLNAPEKPNALDCSGLSAGLYHANFLTLPEGSQNQYNFTKPVIEPKLGDLAFFGRERDPQKVYHVGVVYDAKNIIEARALDETAKFETGKVILRPREKWERYANFLGYRAHPQLMGA